MEAKKNIRHWKSSLLSDTEAGEEKREVRIKAKAFMIGEIIKGERRLAKMTQEQSANKIGPEKASFLLLKMRKPIFSFQRYLDC